MTTSRLFFTHVFLLPALIAAAIALHLFTIWRQKHGQFPGPGRSTRNVIGSPLWPHYTMRTIALASAIAAVVALLGACFEINPIWLYGPYDPWTVSIASQPDWYMGWLEGALRLGPPWALHLFGHTIPPQFFAAVLLPAIVAALFLAWPFIERAITRDEAEHHLLDVPRLVPWRTSLGVAALCFLTILTLAGGDDVQAALVHVPVESLVTVYRVLLVAGPILAALLTLYVCRDLDQRRLSAQQVLLYRTAAGGFEAEPLRSDGQERGPAAAASRK